MANLVCVDISTAMLVTLSLVQDVNALKEHPYAYELYKTELKATIFHDEIEVYEASYFEGRHKLVPVYVISTCHITIQKLSLKY